VDIDEHASTHDELVGPHVERAVHSVGVCTIILKHDIKRKQKNKNKEKR
jgi:hypothetical protein